MVKHELRVTSYELRDENLKARVECLKTRVKIQKYEFKSTSYKFKPTSYKLKSTSSEFKYRICEFKSTIYEFKSTSYDFKSTSSRIIKSMKTQVNSLEGSLFPKIINPKLFCNSWGNSYVRFLVIISCFTILTAPWLRLQQEAEWVNFNFERRHLNSPQISHRLPDDFYFAFFFTLT